MSSGGPSPLPSQARARPLRVAHLVLGLEIGGLEKVVLDLVRLADRRVLEPHVISLGEAGGLAPQFAAANVPVTALSAGSRRAAIVPFLRLVRRLQPDILHTHNARPHQVGAIARALGCVGALVHTKHGRNDPENWRTVVGTRVASILSDVIVSVSADAAEVARRVESVAPSKVVVIHNGIDTSWFQPSPPRALPSSPVAICVARLEPVKDHLTLLRATRQVVDERPDFRLDLVGDGSARGAIERSCRELGLGKNVFLHGTQRDVRSLLASADVFVMASVSEGISLTLLEAMACGLPCVATDAGGNREVIVPGETGLIVPCRDASAIAQSLLLLLNQPDRRLQMGRAARTRIESHFDLRETVSSYTRLYSEVMKPRAARHFRL